MRLDDVDLLTELFAAELSRREAPPALHAWIEHVAPEHNNLSHAALCAQQELANLLHCVELEQLCPHSLGASRPGSESVLWINARTRRDWNRRG